jgi:sec-independent protein translocase protein TatC
MPGAIRTTLHKISHEDRLSTVDHLDELRTRLIVSLVAIAVAFGFCFWQNRALLRLIDSPLSHQTQAQVSAGHGPLGATYAVSQSARDIAVQLDAVVRVLDAPGQRTTPAARAILDRVGAGLSRDINRLSRPPEGDKPVTLGIGEPFTTTITISRPRSTPPNAGSPGR